MTALATPLRYVQAPELWTLLSALAARARAAPLLEPCGLWLEADGSLGVGAPGRGWLSVDPRVGAFEPRVSLPDHALGLLDLYLPLCIGAHAAELVLGHVGQSLDGQIATASGASRSISGPEGIVHLHRLRALFDAVVVGARTAEQDDPALTTRLVDGPNPTRVVLDPTLRLSPTLRVLSDGAAPTLVVCGRGAGVGRDRLGRARIVEVARQGDVLPPRAVVEALRRCGLTRLFVEGGGVTVSRFLEARALDRLQVTISPVLVGEGRPGLKLPPISGLERALRPKTRRFSLGDDVLFECQFGRGSPRA